MRQLAGTKTRYRRAPAAPLAGLINDYGLPEITVSSGEHQSTRPHLDGARWLRLLSSQEYFLVY